MKNSRIYLIIAVLALAAVIVWYFFFRVKIKPIETTAEAVEVLSQNPPVTVETNPIKKVPSLNPVEKTNPFKIPNPF